MSKIIEGPRSTAAEISAGTKNILQAALDGNLEEYSPEDLIRARAEAELQRLAGPRVARQGENPDIRRAVGVCYFERRQSRVGRFDFPYWHGFLRVRTNYTSSADHRPARIGARHAT